MADNNEENNVNEEVKAEEIEKKLENLEIKNDNEVLSKETAATIIKQAQEKGFFNDLIIFAATGEVISSYADKVYDEGEIMYNLLFINVI